VTNALLFQSRWPLLVAEIAEIERVWEIAMIARFLREKSGGRGKRDAESSCARAGPGAARGVVVSCLFYSRF